VASELLLTGRFINAQRSLATGLVSEVVPDDQLDAAAQRLVDDMLRTSPLGLRLTKECLNASVDAGSLDQVIAMEDRNQILCTQTNDFREGVMAFLQKRQPQYTES
jgi:enoyl-CoA hydratase